MYENLLPKALFLSLTVHTVFVCSFLFDHPSEREFKPKPRGVEIAYRPQTKPKAPDVREHPIKPAQQVDLKNSLMSASDGTVPLKMGRENQTPLKNFMIHERKPEQIRSTQMTHRVAVTQIKSAKINNPAYAAYNEMVRSRIEGKVYENFRKMEAGAVYLTFIIASDGTLKAAQVIDAKTTASSNLRAISMESLKDSQFPPFLKGMTLPEYTFNIEIQYQVKD